MKRLSEKQHNLYNGDYSPYLKKGAFAHIMVTGGLNMQLGEPIKIPDKLSIGVVTHIFNDGTVEIFEKINHFLGVCMFVQVDFDNNKVVKRYIGASYGKYLTEVLFKV